MTVPIISKHAREIGTSPTVAGLIGKHLVLSVITLAIQDPMGKETSWRTMTMSMPQKNFEFFYLEMVYFGKMYCSVSHR